jgi:hypothetical protein
MREAFRQLLGCGGCCGQATAKTSESSTTKTTTTRPLKKRPRKSTEHCLVVSHPAVLVMRYDTTNKCIKTSKARTIAGQFREIKV